MNEDQEKISALLTSLIADKQPPSFAGDGLSYRLEPASDLQLETFLRRARANKVPSAVSSHLAAFYCVANSFWYHSVLGFHSCDDEIVFEWWADGELWLSLRDLYVIRWRGGKYCLGDASSPSFSPSHEADTILQLLQICALELQPLEG